VSLKASNSTQGSNPLRSTKGSLIALN